MNTTDFKIHGMRGQVTGYGVYLRINKNYVATVRRLEDLVNYLRDVGDTDETFGVIVSENGANAFHIRLIEQIVKKFKRFKASKYVGRIVYVNRNQGIRSGKVVAGNENGFVVEYQMPNGTTSLNIIKDLRTPDKYKSIGYKRALNSRAFGAELREADLINNPQK